MTEDQIREKALAFKAKFDALEAERQKALAFANESQQTLMQFIGAFNALNEMLSDEMKIKPDEKVN